ncbi:MAG: hypothetical protein GOV00_03585 [Candidatus Altiarchaeota archaeon]|nr:hypothetical protein [Candidatus Altiarchaeota archaeon]
MRKWLLLLPLILVILIIPSGYIGNRGQSNKSNIIQIVIRENCRELEGHLCQAEGQCALPWMDSSDSYCCPLECGECIEEVLSECKTDEVCVEATCGVETDFTCEYWDVVPCKGNGICEAGEYDGLTGPIIAKLSYLDGSFVLCGKENSAGENAGIGRSVPGKMVPTSDPGLDCIDGCSDNNISTSDYFNTTLGRCVHIPCDLVCGDGICGELEIYYEDGIPTKTVCYQDCEEEWIQVMDTHPNTPTIPNNDVCEPLEIETCWAQDSPQDCCPGVGHVISSKTVESQDCPENCDDGNENTADYYDFSSQTCRNYIC